MGNFHPHGDQAIYDALARMAQDFSPAPPARRRPRQRSAPPTPSRSRPRPCATPSARLAPLAMQLLGEHRRGHRRLQPTATTATPSSRSCSRRASRTCSSTAARASRSAWRRTSRRTTSARSSTRPLHLIDNPDATPDDLMEFVQGPDFPTGGVDPRSQRHPRRVPHRSRLDQDARGRRDRGGQERRAHRRHRDPVPDVGRGDRRKIADLVNDRKIDGIRDLRNESAKGNTGGSSSS